MWVDGCHVNEWGSEDNLWVSALILPCGFWGLESGHQTGGASSFTCRTRSLTLLFSLLMSFIAYLLMYNYVSHVLGKCSAVEVATHQPEEEVLFFFPSLPEIIFAPFGSHHATENAWRVILFPVPISAWHWEGRPYISSPEDTQGFLLIVRWI